MPQRERYVHYTHYGIAEPKRHENLDGVWYIAACKCGWESTWRFREWESADDDASEHMKSMADER
jgi:hypothetical protein